MASFTIPAYPEFSVGATVSLYPSNGQRPPAAGAVLDAAAVQPDGTVTFTNLVEGTHYLAGVGSGASFRGVDFTTGYDATSPGGAFDQRELATDREVADAIARHASDTTDVHGIADTSQLESALSAVRLDHYGTTNALMQQLLNEAAGVESVLVPPGVALQTDGLVVPSLTELFGVGPGSVLTVSPSTGLYPLFVQAGSHDVRMHDFAIDGNKANIAGNPDVSGNPANCVMVGDDTGPVTNRVYVERVYVHDSKRLGIVFQNVQTGAIRDNVVENNDRDGITVYFDTKDVVISGNKLSGNSDDQIGINSEDGVTTGHLCERIDVVGNVLTGPGSRVSNRKGRGMTVRGGGKINILGNVITDVSQAAIVLNDYNATTLKDVVVASNVIDRPGYLGSAEKDGVRIETGETGSTIQRLRVQGNTIRSAGQLGIKVANGKTSKADDDIRDVVIAGNSVFDCTLEGIGIATGVGVNDVTIESNLAQGNGNGGIIVDAGALKRIYVRNNRVLRNTGKGIVMRQVAAGALAGNHVYDDRGGAATQTHGINVFGLSGNFDFSQNTVWGHVTADYQDDGGHAATFQGPYRMLSASATWDPPSLADGAMAQATIAVPGAAVGDMVSGIGLNSLSSVFFTMVGTVSGADTVTVNLTNRSGGTFNVGSGTLRVEVRKYL